MPPRYQIEIHGHPAHVGMVNGQTVVELGHPKPNTFGSMTAGTLVALWYGLLEFKVVPVGK